MPRIRNITPGFFDDPDVGDLTPFARLFFIGLWTQADREGRLVDDMRRLKARIFPYDDTDLDALADELHRKDMIRRYQDGAGTRLIWIRQFSKHQRPHHKETASVIAACPPDGGAYPEKVSACPVKARLNPPESGVLNLESGDLESGGSFEPQAAPKPAVLTFPIVGSSTTTMWRLTQDQLDTWVTLYPSLDVLAECRKALAWIGAHSDRRKTARGVPKFLVGWLNRAVDNRRGGGPAQLPASADTEAATVAREQRQVKQDRDVRAQEEREALAAAVLEELRPDDLAAVASIATEALRGFKARMGGAAYRQAFERARLQAVLAQFSQAELQAKLKAKLQCTKPLAVRA